MRYVTNREALQTVSPPSEMYVRESELTELRQTLNPIPNGHPATGAVIYGPSGAGKTHSTQLIISQLIESVRETAGRDTGRFEPTVADDDGPAEIATTHIDCWKQSSKHAILTKLLAGLDEHAQPSNAPSSELADGLADALEHPYIVILDEAGQIDDDGVLKTLHEISEVTLFCIVNEYRPFLRSLEMGVESRLEGYKDIEFDAYTEAQLEVILEGRIEHGVADGVVPAEIVELLAEVSKHDARRAIDNLRWTVHEVRDNGMDAVTPTLVREAVPETERELIKTTFSKLSRDQRILYEILVEDGGELAIGEIHDRFLERVSDANPASKKTAKRELKKMSHYHIVDFQGKNSARRYEAATDELYSEEVV